MKNLLLLLFISSITVINAQTDTLSNFKLSEDRTVKYQTIFTSKDTININLLKSFVSTKSNIKNVELTDQTITGSIDNMRINYEKYGGSYMTTLIILNHSLSADFTIELKENRYRVTIKNMVFTDKESAFAYNSTNPEVNETRLSDYVIKNRKPQFRSGSVIVDGLEYANLHFIDTFTYSKPEKDDW